MADKCTATKSQLQEAFNKMDQNGDGTATYQEIKQCLMDTCGFSDTEAIDVLEVGSKIFVYFALLIWLFSLPYNEIGI